MGFDVNGFKNAFLSGLLGAANSVTQNNRIDRGTAEVANANQVVSAFKDQLKNISDPIGDTVSFSTKEEVTVDDLLAFVDPDISAKVKEYAVTKPVETIKVYGKVNVNPKKSVSALTKEELFDILLDSNLKAWLMEINVGASLGTN